MNKIPSRTEGFPIVSREIAGEQRSREDQETKTDVILKSTSMSQNIETANEMPDYYADEFGYKYRRKGQPYLKKKDQDVSIYYVCLIFLDFI